MNANDQLILSYLGEDTTGLSSPVLAEVTGLTKDQVRHALGRLNKQGAVLSYKSGASTFWKLVEYPTRDIDIHTDPNNTPGRCIPVGDLSNSEIVFSDNQAHEPDKEFQSQGRLGRSPYPDGGDGTIVIDQTAAVVPCKYCKASTHNTDSFICNACAQAEGRLTRAGQTEAVTVTTFVKPVPTEPLPIEVNTQGLTEAMQQKITEEKYREEQRRIAHRRAKPVSKLERKLWRKKDKQS